MLEHLERVSTIYDLLALCCSYILKENQKKAIEFGEFDKEYDEVYDAVENYCNDCENVGQWKALYELKEFVIKFMRPEVSVEKCFALVKYIDELVEIELNGKIMGGNHIIKYTALNEQYKDYVIIRPKMKDNFLNKGEVKLENGYSFLRKRRECVCSILDRETVNYMVWDEEHIKKYPLSRVRYDNMHPLVSHFRENNRIVLGIVPFSSESTERLMEIQYHAKLFTITGIKPDIEKQLRDRYIEICDRAETERIDILIFPEMLMTETIMTAGEKKDRKESPWIIVNGSIWKDCMNKSIVTDGNGNEIFTYFKKEPFVLKRGKKEYREWLNKEKNTEYFILEIDGIGRIGVGICKDLINEEVKMFHKMMKTDLLIVPSYTDSMDLQGAAEDLSKEYNCVVAMVNACSAVEKKCSGKENMRVGFITLPAKKDTDRTEVTIRYYKTECAEKCSTKCVGKKIIIDFLHRKRYEEKESYNVIESTF